MTVEQVRAAFQRWYSLVESGSDVLTALKQASAPECIVHSQNGDVGIMRIVDGQIAQVRLAFPDLELEVDHLMLTEDRVLAQLTLEGSAVIPFRTTPPRRLRSIGALMARIDERAEIVETWPYLNPGAAVTFPTRTKVSAPPQPSGTPGTETQARALCAEWARAITVAEFVQRIVTTSAPNCLAHATNGDSGRVDLLEEEFAVVSSAFPDVIVEFEGAAFSGERFISQFMLTGTHRGPLGIMSPSGRRASSTGAIAGRVDDSGRAMELWVYLAPGMGLLFPRAQEPRE